MLIAAIIQSTSQVDSKAGEQKHTKTEPKEDIVMPTTPAKSFAPQKKEPKANPAKKAPSASRGAPSLSQEEEAFYNDKHEPQTL